MSKMKGNPCFVGATFQTRLFNVICLDGTITNIPKTTATQPMNLKTGILLLFVVN